jgi:hypothetical protein
MTLSPQDRAAVIELAATKLVAEIRQGCDLAELVTLPVGAVGQMIGLGAAQVARVMTTRPMGARKRGVSLKTLQTYLSKP